MAHPLGRILYGLVDIIPRLTYGPPWVPERPSKGESHTGMSLVRSRVVLFTAVHAQSYQSDKTAN